MSFGSEIAGAAAKGLLVFVIIVALTACLSGLVIAFVLR